MKYRRARSALVTATFVAAFPLAAQRPDQWYATWATANFAAPAPLPDSADRVPFYFDQTIRQVVRVTLGGAKVRLRLTNEFGERPLVIGAAHVAARDSGARVRGSTDRTVTFGGKGAVTLRPGVVVVSDPISLEVAALSDLSVSIWVRDTIRGTTRHPGAHQTSYLSPHGDYTAAAAFTPAKTIAQWYWLAGVDVRNSAATGVVVAFGNSITDGNGSTLDANARWPDFLAKRLLSGREPMKGVVNVGISGNRILSPMTGPSALARFDRDVVMQPGVTHVVLLEGINDLLHGSAPYEAHDSASVEEIIFGYEQLIARAHEHGLLIYGATLTPIGGVDRRTAAAADAKRREVNKWIRSSGAFDGVIDFDSVTRDPANPDRFFPAFDSGDHLHPGDAGYKAMGESVDLRLFRRTRRRP